MVGNIWKAASICVAFAGLAACEHTDPDRRFEVEGWFHSAEFNSRANSIIGWEQCGEVSEDFRVGGVGDDLTTHVCQTVRSNGQCQVMAMVEYREGNDVDRRWNWSGPAAAANVNLQPTYPVGTTQCSIREIR
ncbi:hypothetical protein [Hyphobacterium sp.]|uniref:hypothetical protein n=1 Tax=Hyphobacterium sp. TaxID=2004662 RepID=UPI003BABA3B9